MTKYFTIPLFILLSLSSSWGTGTDESLTQETISLPKAETGSGTTYYVSPSGDDTLSGLTPVHAWQSIERVNNASLSPGDSVLFERDGVYRGTLYPRSGISTAWISYSSYGTGEKPQLNGSVALNDAAHWENVASKIWRSTEASPFDIGAVYYNGTSQIGFKKWNQAELTAKGDFYYNESDNKLYIYADSSPESVFTSIEASLTRHVIDHSNSRYILFENLHLTKGSAHGFGGGETDHLIIQNCDFSYLGGGFLFYHEGEPVRYGNGIEFWGNAASNLVRNCRFWEIYDTALTNQNHSAPAIQKNIFYINNMIYNCGLASFEIWNRPSSSQISHVYFIHNSSINPGQGWGADHRIDKNSFHIASYSNKAVTDNIVIKNNIFYSSTQPSGADNINWFHLYFYDENANNNYVKYIIDNNLWQMPEPLWAVKSDPSAAPLLFSALNDWQAINNQSLNAVTGDPLFSDITHLNLVPLTGSPAIDSGTDSLVDLRFTDFGGNSTVGMPDMGVWEN